MSTTEISIFRREGVDARKTQFGGYLYVIEFSTGLVKVGRTQNPAKRFETHRSHGAAFGVIIARYWLSEAHDNFESNEALLIRAMHNLGGIPSKAEYFDGVTVESAVQAASALHFDAVDTEGHLAKSAAAAEELRVALWGDRNPVEELRSAEAHAKAQSADPYSVIDRLFGAIVGSVNNAHAYPPVARDTVPLSALRPLAEFKGIPVSEVASWSMIDFLEETVKLRARVAALQLTIWAREYGRDDLTDSMIVEVSA